MNSSIIITVIATLLLVGYIVGIRALIASYCFSVKLSPSYSDCNPTSCGNSIIQYPLGTCGFLSADCSENQITLHYDSSFYAQVVGDIRNSSNSPRTLQISVISEFSRADHLTSMYVWLKATGFFNVSTVPEGLNITWSISDTCLSCRATGGRCVTTIYSQIEYVEDCICPNNEFHSRNCTDGGEDMQNFISSPISICFTLSYSLYSAISVPFPVFLHTLVEHSMPPEYMAGIFFGEFGAFIILLVSCIVFHRGCCCKRTENDDERTIIQFMDPLGSTPPTVENFLNYYSSQVPTRYSYSQIRIYTNNLAEQLGKGGFGTVYKGKLPSGRLIAVKILDESKQSEQQFIAEVGTVGSTYHVNLVRMLGFCSEGTKRALVYEYMVNGSLEKYIHGNHQDSLDWKQLYSLAIGTARGILYLHDECRNRILHCDIKPHNVLLDANFLPKIADFGLAKISRREESHISAAHGGTLGYAAPEMWSRIYGPVTDRSDVYSYGMLIMEMVGGRKNIDNLESRSSKFFYPEWAFKQVEKGEFGNLRTGYISEEDQRLTKKLSLVGLWCIQFHASRRPPMSKVIQMLEGDVEITTPPFPLPVDTPPIALSDQSSVSNNCSSISASEVQMTDPKSTVETSSLLLPSSLNQSSSSNQCSSSYALEIEMTDPRSTQIANTSG